MSTLDDHIQKLILFRKMLQSGDNVSILLESPDFRKEALVLCAVHLDELAALASRSEAPAAAGDARVVAPLSGLQAQRIGNEHRVSAAVVQDIAYALAATPAPEAGDEQ